MIHSEYVDSDGVLLHVAVAGDESSPALLLIHGWPETHRCWEAVVPRLAGDFRLLMPDLRGFGESAMPVGTASYTMQVVVGDAVAVLDHFGVRSAGVVGHDFGGAVAWALGAFLPHLVERMVVLSSPHPLRFRQAAIEDPSQLQRSFYAWLMHAGPEGEALLGADGFRRLAAWAFEGSDVAPETIAAYIASWAEPGRFHAMAEWYRANFRPSLFDPGHAPAIPPVTVPVRYLHGGDDVAFVPGAATGSGAFVDAPFDEQVIQGAGHWLTHDVPDLVADQVRDWMNRPLPASGTRPAL